MHREVHNCSRGVSIKNYEPRIEKSDWSIQTSHGRNIYIYIYIYLHVYTFLAATTELPIVSPALSFTSMPSLSSWFLINITLRTLAVAIKV